MHYIVYGSNVKKYMVALPELTHEIRFLVSIDILRLSD